MFSEMTKLHVIYTPFTGVGLYGGYRGDEWFRERIRVFKKFTLPSLRQQGRFVHWLSFRPEERGNPICKELLAELESSGYPFVATFDGLMYWDDKFPTDLRGKLRVLWNHLRWAYRKGRWETVLPMIREVWWSKNATLEERLTDSLVSIMLHPILSDWDGDLDYVYLTRIDSDDCLADGVLASIREADPERYSVVTFLDGCIYREETGELCTWEPRTNPPFHTIIFSGRDFFIPYRHLARYGGYRSHEDAPDIGNTLYLGNPHPYLVTVHGRGNHISTTWDHPFRGSEITGEERERVLRSFAIEP
jgi:hypothetical protein